MVKLKAILSSTVLPVDGIYQVSTLSGVKPIAEYIKGVPHYIGHPATQQIVEDLGAVKAPTNLFTGLQEGECALVVSIKQGRSTRKDNGFTSPHQDVSLEDLDFRLITRVETHKCWHCGHESATGFEQCPICGTI